jgi:hypothetical protein
MKKPGIEDVFVDALDTFKAFDNLTVVNSGANQQAFPTSIWQILNHLTLWQEYQIGVLKGIIPEGDISEKDTWIKEREPQDETTLQKVVDSFKLQLETIKAEIKSVLAENSLTKLVIIQQLSLHLSFHLGEVVLIRRLNGSYPPPHQMKEFLQQ